MLLTRHAWLIIRSSLCKLLTGSLQYVKYT